MRKKDVFVSGPILIINQDVLNTEILSDGEAERNIRERFRKLDADCDAYSKICYLGSRYIPSESKENGTNGASSSSMGDSNEKLRALIETEVRDESTRIKRKLTFIFSALEVRRVTSLPP